MQQKRVTGIRGLNEPIYNEIKKFASITRQNIPEVVNEALFHYLQNVQEGFITLKLIMEFVINRSDDFEDTQ